MSTYVCGDTRKDDLGLVGCLDCRLEVGVVPGVDFTLTLDERRIWVERQDLRRKGAVGS